MTNVLIPPDQVQDPAEKNEPGLGQGRDPERTPMVWDDSPGAGFTTGVPWLPIGDDYAVMNVAVQEGDPTSMLHLYRRLIQMRRTRPALVSGKLQLVKADGHLLSFESVEGDERLLVALNLGYEPVRIPLENASILISTGLNREGESATGSLDLRPAEGLVLRRG
jgi:alpha-glucosidase